MNQAWHEERRKGLGASDAGAVIGIDPWRSRLDVWSEKTEGLRDERESLAMWLGTALEPVVADLFESRMGLKVRRESKARWSREWPWMFAHLDGKVVNAPFGFEAKTSGSLLGWGQEGTADIPPHYFAQVQHQMAVTGMELTYVALLALGQPKAFRVYEVPLDPGYIEDLVDVEREFWETNVLAGVPPLPDGSDAAREWLRRRYPTDAGVIRVATPEERMLVRQLTPAKQAMAEAERALAEVENRIKAAIGDDSGLEGPGFKVTWKKTKDAEVVDWKTVADAYRNVVVDLYGRLDDESRASLAIGPDVRAGLATIEGLYTSTREGTRRFNVNISE